LLKGFEHGDECQALIEEVEHPLRHFRFWNVVKVAPLDAPPLKPRGSYQRRVTGYLCITNQNIENKHDERLFFCATGAPVRIPLPKRVRKHYKQLIEDYQDRHADDVKRRRRRHERDSSVPLPDKPEGKTPAFSRFILDPEETELEHGALVYVMLERVGQAGKVKFIVPVSVPRVGYEQTIGDRLDPGVSPEESLVHKCRDYNHLCPACRVFGWVYGTDDPDEHKPDVDQRTAYAGRVRLTHATPVDGQVHQYADKITLGILSSPKPTTTRFYLRPTDGPPRDGLRGNQVDYSKEADQRLRGRKFYRHHGDQLDKQEITSPKGKRSDQNRTIKGVVKPESVFEFDLEFENLGEVELGALLWALELDGWHHRLGLGKPLGLGSVTIEADLKLLDPIRRYTKFESGWIGEQDEEAYIKAFQEAMEARYGGNFYDLDNICDLKALLAESSELPVHYPRSTPRPQPEGKNYEWFVGNKRKGGPRVALRLTTEDTEGLPLVNRYGETV
jgi:CRISPR-associated protein (TIGR03986 family)